MNPALLLIASALAAPPRAAASGAPAPTATCTAPLSISALDTALAGAEFAWGVDEATFGRSVTAARAALACVAEPLSPARAARFHRIEGLAAFLARDDARTAAAFAAARALDPDYSFPVAMVPAQNPLRAAYDAVAVPAAGRSHLAPAPKGATVLWFDGTDTRARPLDRAAVFQVQERGGGVGTSAWVMPDAPLPAYRLRGEGLRVPLLVGAGALAAGAGVLWALGADAHGDYYQSTSVTEADDHRATAQTLGVASLSVGAAAVATGAGAFLFARW